MELGREDEEVEDLKKRAQRILVALEVNLNRETNIYVGRGRGTTTLLRPLQTPLWIRS